MLNKNVLATEIIVVEKNAILTNITSTWSITKLDEDLVDTAFKNSIKTEPQLFEVWEVVRRNG